MARAAALGLRLVLAVGLAPPAPAAPWQPLAPLACAVLSPWQTLWTAPAAERLAWVQQLGPRLSAEQATLLATLAWDDALTVRMAAQDAAQSRCAQALALTCSDFVRAFAEARQRPGVWRARVALMHSTALPPHPDTLAEEPLALVARLGGLLRHGRAAAPARAALHTLAQDGDAHVQEAAAAALMGEGE